MIGEPDILMEYKEERETMVKLSREYDFEGRKISSVDISGLASLTAADDAEVCQFIFMRKNRVVMVRGFDTDYCIMILARATKLPMEFFYQLSLSDSNTLMSKARAFF